jgi:hypothetical protein
MAKGPFLVDATLDASLQEDGFVVVDLLDAEELLRVTAAQLALRCSGDSGLTIDFARHNRRVMHEIHALLAPIWERHLPGLFSSYRPVVSTFVVKHPGPGSEMLLHNEPTFVDPEFGPCFNVWIPLVDVDPSLDNGVLELVPGSQDLPAGLSGFDTPVLFRPFERYIRRFAQPVSVRAGQAVIYDTRMLHASRENRSSSPRPAIAAAVAPVGAPLIHVLSSGRHGREVYEVDESFFLDHHPMEVGPALRSDHRLVDRRRHERALLGSEVAEALGGDDVPAPEVVLPPDVSEALPSGSAQVLPVVEATALTHLELPALVQGLSDEAHPGSHWELRRVHGGSRRVPIAGGDPGWEAALRSAGAVVPGRPVRRTIVALDPGARAELVGDLAGSSLVVLDAAMVSAGMLHDLAVAQLEPGSCVELSAAGSALLWNDGACPLVACVVEPDPPRAAASGVVDRFQRAVARIRRGTTA